MNDQIYIQIKKESKSIQYFESRLIRTQVADKQTGLKVKKITRIKQLFK